MKTSAVVIMSKVPRAGKTKTRLMPNLTGEACASFHRACLMDICALIDAAGVPGYLFYDGDKEALCRGRLLEDIAFSAAQRYRNHLARLTLLPQRGENLGGRMADACREVLAKHQQVVIIGADLPDLSAALLEEAFHQLASHDLVIGPAADGGYYLIGMKNCCPEIFTGIHWGEASVFAETMAAVRLSGLSSAELAEKNDIDTWADLLAYYRNGEADPAVRQLVSHQWLKSFLTQNGI